MSTSTEFRSAPFFLTSHFLLFILFFSFHSFFPLFFFLEYYPEIVVCFPFFFRLFTSSVIEGDLFDTGTKLCKIASKWCLKSGTTDSMAMIITRARL